MDIPFVGWVSSTSADPERHIIDMFEHLFCAVKFRIVVMVVTNIMRVISGETIVIFEGRTLRFFSPSLYRSLLQTHTQPR